MNMIKPPIGSRQPIKRSARNPKEGGARPADSIEADDD
jgi:hypothetical protein